FPIFIDEVQVTKFFNNSSDEPLVHFKLTHIVQSNEWVLEYEADQSVLPIPKQFRDAQSIEEVSKISSDHKLNYDQLNPHFSGKQLAILRMLAGGNSITIQDVLTAYIILTLNKYCYNNNDECRILHTITIVNCRGVSDFIAPQGQVSNSLFMMLSNDFDDPYSLSNIAKTIRQSIIQLR
ncbi:unnamed protein product, partial [Rotaria sordida]